ncbi:BLUF domain-containing protein [Sphingomonas sp. NY01]|uniref:BLUF domain-containing protein n=1 Tax=Sphingomonas sp. NY01 TaxID=2968057 RepID=UPI00315CDE65
MRQLVYISTVRSGAPVEADAILAASRRNNARANVTGLLFFDGKRFLQALEGDDAVVDATYARIQADPRHHALVVLSDRNVEERSFGPWAMAYRAPGEDDGASLARIELLTANASATVQATFASFARIKRAA